MGGGNPSRKVGDEQLRLLPGAEMAAAWLLAPAHDVATAPLRAAPRAHVNLLGCNGYNGCNGCKSALNAVTVAFAKELDPLGFEVNAGCPGYTATDLNQHQGHRTPEQGVAIGVRLATLPDDGPNGGFFNDDGVVTR